MAWMAHRAGIGVVFSPRSGLILRDLERGSFWRWWVRWVLRQSDRVLCQSGSWRTVYARVSGLPEERFVVIRNWIESRPYRNLPEPPAPPPVRVLYIGWFAGYKGVYDLVEMVNQRRNDLADVRFVMCGQGAEFEDVRRRIHVLRLADRFELPGWVRGEEKLRQLQQAHIFVLPSHYEGFPNALLEAMAAGKPVVATSVGGVPEVIADPGLGRLVPPGDLTALGNAIVELARDGVLRSELGRNARAHVVAHHDIGQVWPAVYRALCEAVGRRTHNSGVHE